MPSKNDSKSPLKTLVCPIVALPITLIFSAFLCAAMVMAPEKTFSVMAVLGILLIILLGLSVCFAISIIRSIALIIAGSRNRRSDMEYGMIEHAPLESGESFLPPDMYRQTHHPPPPQFDSSGMPVDPDMLPPAVNQDGYAPPPVMPQEMQWK